MGDLGPHPQKQNVDLACKLQQRGHIVKPAPCPGAHGTSNHRPLDHGAANTEKSGAVPFDRFGIVKHNLVQAHDLILSTAADR